MHFFRNKRINLRLLSGALIATLSSTPLLADTLDDFANQTLDEWQIPGLALAVIHNGETVKTAGYGVKERTRNEPVNPETLFQIASLTKAFTGLTVAMLEEEGKIAWDKPIRSYLPSIRYKDRVANEQMTLKDLLSHQTGLPGIFDDESSLWAYKELSASDLMEQLETIEPLYPIRSHFKYCNLGYVTASEVVAKIAGMPWEQFCSENIFTPLQMSRTTLSHDRLLLDSDVATPHDSQGQPIDFLRWDSTQAAGGIISCAQDLATWMDYCLKMVPHYPILFAPHSLLDGRELVGGAALSTWELYSHGQETVHYGLGWMMYTLHNKTVYFHLGLSPGMSSMMALVPDEDLGIVILTNQQGHFGDINLLNQILDHYIDKTPPKKKSLGIKMGN